VVNFTSRYKKKYTKITLMVKNVWRFGKLYKSHLKSGCTVKKTFLHISLHYGLSGTDKKYKAITQNCYVKLLQNSILGQEKPGNFLINI